jgi:3-methyl-2-oxobutanoate hydroxymethyltransferase
MRQLTLQDLVSMKQKQKKISVLTVYDASFAQIACEAGVDVLLVGDSLGMVLKGQENTLQVSVADIAYHVAAVTAGNRHAIIMADLPFLSYYTPEIAAAHAKTLMQAGAHLLKIEGGTWLVETIAYLTQRGIPICAHLGLTPQYHHLLGGFKVQGRNQDQAKQILEAAVRLEEAGAQLLVLECVPYPLAEKVSQTLSIPVIGIGAGPYCDGQVLVLYDMLGITPNKVPKFVKNYLAETKSVQDAITKYVHEVQENVFPTLEHSFE